MPLRHFVSRSVVYLFNSAGTECTVNAYNVHCGRSSHKPDVKSRNAFVPATESVNTKNGPYQSTTNGPYSSFLSISDLLLLGRMQSASHVTSSARTALTRHCVVETFARSLEIVQHHWKQRAYTNWQITHYMTLTIVCHCRCSTALSVAVYDTLTLKSIVTLTSTLGVVQGHWKWYHSQAWVGYGFLLAVHSDYGRIFSRFDTMHERDTDPAMQPPHQRKAALKLTSVEY